MIKDNIPRGKYLDFSVLLLFIVLGSLLYSKTLVVPWLFDDIQNITENPLIKSIPATINNIFAPRGIAYLTFALNYHFGGLDVAGFHLVNISFHIIASWFAYLLAKRAFCPSTIDEPGFSFYNSHFAPITAGLIFLLHPIQTQAVNYIVQRMTGLSALFFLIALYCHVRFRESKQGFLWYILAMVVASLALMTKQNAAVIPGALLLFDWLILSQGRRPQFFTRRMLAVVPFFLLSCLFIYMQVGKNDLLLKDAGVAEYWAKAGETSATKKIAPSDPAPPAGELPKARRLDKPPENLQAIYFVTELSVLWLYLKLLILPYGQIFDYGYPLANKLLDFQTITAGSGLLLLLLLAIALAMKRQPLVAFGVFWFFLALAVESTIIPLDAAVEHRLYMPVFGLAVSMVALIRHFAGGRKGLIILCCIVVAYGVATWQRNSVWADPVAFGLDGVVKAPHNQRNHLTLATAYADAGRWADAEKTLRVAIPLRPYYHVPYDNLGSALAQQGRLAESRAFFSMAAILAPSYPNAVYNYGFVSLRLGDVPASLRSLQRLKELGSPLAAKLGAQFMNK